MTTPELIRDIVAAGEAECLFAVLGLPERATPPSDVRAAFRRRSLLCHPDKCNLSGAQQAFQALAAAYECLHDPVVQHRMLRAATAAPVAQPYWKRAKRQTADKEPRCRSWAEVERELQRQEELQRTFLAAQRRRYSDRNAVHTLQRAERCTAELDERSGLMDNPLLSAVASCGDVVKAPSRAPEVPPAGRWDHDGCSEIHLKARRRRKFTEEGPMEAPEPSSRRRVAFVAAGAGPSSPTQEAPPAPPPQTVPLLDDSERLLHLLLYLRETHLYCLFCGRAFASREQLETHCPGALEEAHEQEGGDCCFGDFD
jgi:hypothetical protein